jgi:hypothetical protein
MLSRDQYGRAVRAFLGEMSASLIGISREKLQLIPGLLEEVQEAAELLRHPSTASNVVLATALGLIDEYVNRAGPKVLGDACAFYHDQHSVIPERTSDS